MFGSGPHRGTGARRKTPGLSGRKFGKHCVARSSKVGGGPLEADLQACLRTLRGGRSPGAGGRASPGSRATAPTPGRRRRLLARWGEINKNKAPRRRSRNRDYETKMSMDEHGNQKGLRTVNVKVCSYRSLSACRKEASPSAPCRLPPSPFGEHNCIPPPCGPPMAARRQATLPSKPGRLAGGLSVLCRHITDDRTVPCHITWHCTASCRTYHTITYHVVSCRVLSRAVPSCAVLCCPAIRHVSRVTCHVSRVTCHVSRVACRVSRVACHVSRVTCHPQNMTSYIKLRRTIIIWQVVAGVD